MLFSLQMKMELFQSVKTSKNVKSEIALSAVILEVLQLISSDPTYYSILIKAGVPKLCWEPVTGKLSGLHNRHLPEVQNGFYM